MFSNNKTVLKTRNAAIAAGLFTIASMQAGYAQDQTYLPDPVDPSNPKLINQINTDPTGPGADVRVGVVKIRVKDMQKDVDFFKAVFGLQEFARTNHTAFLAMPNGTLLSNQPKNTYIAPIVELILDPTLVLPRVKTYVTCFMVKDLAAWRERTKKLGYKTDDRGKSVSTMSEPSGWQMEVVQDFYFGMPK